MKTEGSERGISLRPPHTTRVNAQRPSAQQPTQLGERGTEGGGGGGRGLELLAGGADALALLLDVEAEVLQEEDRARGGVRARGLDLGADAVLQEDDGPAGGVRVVTTGLAHGRGRQQQGAIEAGSSSG